MSIRAFCRMWNPLGVLLKDITSEFSLDYTINTSPGGVGALELVGSFDISPSLLLPDNRIGVYRSIDGRPPYLDNNAIYLLEGWDYTSKNVVLHAQHMNTIASRRYILYSSGTTFANKSATFSDDLVKAFWRENAGSLVDSTRDGAETGVDLSTYISVQADRSLGASVGMSGSRDPLDNVLKRICDASATAGTYLTYEIVALSETAFEFRTYTTVRGIDRGPGTTFQLIFSENRGNLENSQVTYDYSREINFVSAGGMGQNSDRLIQTSLDTNRINQSPFHRIERFADMSNVGDPTVLQDDADAWVRLGRPVVSLKGNLINIPSCTRGIHFDVGDILAVEAPRTRDVLSIRFETVHEHFESSGPSQGYDVGATVDMNYSSTAYMRSTS